MVVIPGKHDAQTLPTRAKVSKRGNVFENP